MLMLAMLMPVMLMVVLLMLEMLMLVMLELVMPNTNDNYAITNAGNAMLMLVQ